MNQVDTTIGYVVDSNTIERPAGHWQLHRNWRFLALVFMRDFLGGGGANTGLGNQAIFANGNRDTSNSFPLNGVSTNNLFNGNSTSQVGEKPLSCSTPVRTSVRAVLSKPSTSCMARLARLFPTPPPDAIQEIAVNSSQYDATQGQPTAARTSAY